MKKLLCTLAFFILLTQTIVFGTELQEPEFNAPSLADKAILVQGSEKPSIYDIPDLSKDIENTTFELREPAKLMSDTEAPEITAFDEFSLKNGVLNGDVFVLCYVKEAFKGNLFFAIYDANGALKQVQSTPITPDEAAICYHTFYVNNLPVSDENYSYNLFLWDANLKPATMPVIYTNTDSDKEIIADKVYADGANVTSDIPTYVKDGYILADVNLFSKIGAQLSYDNDTSVLWIEKNNVSVGMYLDDNRLYVFRGSSNYAVDATYSNFISDDGTIYVPVPDICEIFGFKAVYNAGENTVSLFSNEILEPSRSTTFNVESESGSNYYTGIPTNDYYSAQINNGLIYFTALGSKYIYVTNGSQTIKYDVGDRPQYVLSEGDYIYFSAPSNVIKRINKKTNKIETLCTNTRSRKSHSDFMYYNGNLYFENSGRIYNIANGTWETYDNCDYPDDDSWIYILDENTICHVYVEHVSKGSNLTFKIIDRRTNKTISSYSTYCTFNVSDLSHRQIAGKYIGDSLYLYLYHWPNGTNSTYLRINLSGNSITSVSTLGKTEFFNVWNNERYTQSVFSTTRTTSDYRFWMDGNVITATDRKTGQDIPLLNLQRRSNKFLFASDNCFIHAIYGIGYIQRDGNDYYQYTGDSALYLDFFDGTSVKLFGTTGY